MPFHHYFVVVYTCHLKKKVEPLQSIIGPHFSQRGRKILVRAKKMLEKAGSVLARNDLEHLWAGRPIFFLKLQASIEIFNDSFDWYFMY